MEMYYTHAQLPIRVAEERLSLDIIEKPLSELTLDDLIMKVDSSVPNKEGIDRFRTVKIEQMGVISSNRVNTAITAVNELYNKHKDFVSSVDMYSVFKIPKSSGGYRTIKAPNEELSNKQKDIRRALESNYALNMKPHDTAYAYVPTRSVRDALVVHQENKSNWFLKLDFKDFFGSCTPELVRTQLSKHFPICTLSNLMKEKLFTAIDNLAYLDNALPQGTPLSPTLTNLVMVEFDYLMTKYAYENKLRYTRYADDILLSSKYQFNYNEVVENVKGILEQNGYETLKLNAGKTRYGSSSGSNWNLGLMYNKDREITIGHKNKRKLKLQMFLFIKNNSLWSLEEVQILNGNLEWLRSNEPKAYEGLIQWFDNKHRVSIKNEIKIRLKNT